MEQPNINQTQVGVLRGVSGINSIVSPPLKYCLYARKSMESDEMQALSIDSQIKEMLELAQRDNIEVVEIRKEAHSAKDSGQRPEFNRLLDDIKADKFNAILAWAPDRLSRNAGDLGSLVDLMDQNILIEIKTYGQRFANSPNEKFLLMILCSQAKLENDNKSINVKRGLRARVEMGLWPGVAPVGYLNEKRVDRKCHVLVDPDRGHIIKQMFERVGNEHQSGREVYRWLNSINFRCRSGIRLSLSNVYTVLRNHFFYGRFEYPKNSGNWYSGKHKPLISKELFEKVQKQLSRDNIVRSECKEFAFTKLMKCGLCGSGITADEKFKKISDGSVRRYVYYGCTRGKNINCKGGYIREEELTNQLIKMVGQISLDELGMKEKIEKEVERYDKFRYGVLGNKKNNNQKQKDIDHKNYAKYILREGNVYEKRELLVCLKTRIIFKNKLIYLEK